MHEEVAVRETTSVIDYEDSAMGIEALKRQVRLIQELMADIMHDGEHYGTIPGTKKPTLLKPGAEKLCRVFRLEPDYEIIREERQTTFITYTIKCTLHHILTGNKIATGLGSCNTEEEKYRWRHIDTPTDTPVPKEYWEARKANDSKEMKRLLGEGNRASKVDGVWVICKSEKIINPNPWELDNTILKMACKRALVAATLNATAASDIFTQDVEDMQEGTAGLKAENAADEKPKKEYKQPQSTDAESKLTQQAPKTPESTPAGLTQREALDAELREYCMTEESLVDTNMYKSLLKTLSRVEIQGRVRFFDEITDKISDAWIGETLKKLRERTRKNG